MRGVTDDLGHLSLLPERVSRVVSLVPSITETVARAGPGLLVGATDWCTQPAGLQLARVRGTKNPDLDAIALLKPDVVLANKEENRQLDVQRLRQRGIAVYVTVIESVPQAVASLGRVLTEVLALAAPPWLAAARALCEPDAPRPDPLDVAVAIWRDPWMVVGRDTFTGDLLHRLGLRNVFADATDRYPHMTPAEIGAARPQVVLLPDEPYRFTAVDGPEALPGLRCALLDGRTLTWYGPSLGDAARVITGAVSHALGSALPGLGSRPCRTSPSSSQGSTPSSGSGSD